LLGKFEAPIIDSAPAWRNPRKAVNHFASFLNPLDVFPWRKVYFNPMKTGSSLSAIVHTDSAPVPFGQQVRWGTMGG